MQLAVEKRIQKDLRETARKMGIQEREVVSRAVLLYLDSVKKILDIEREFSAWDALSDEALHGLAMRLTARL